MGFPPDDVNAALQATNNDYEAACEWLLGDRDNDMVFARSHTN
jgi:uncharacterized UBP type Zn finger protein